MLKSNDRLTLEPELGPRCPDLFARPPSPSLQLSTSCKSLRTSAYSFMREPKIQNVTPRCQQHGESISATSLTWLNHHHVQSGSQHIFATQFLQSLFKMVSQKFLIIIFRSHTVVVRMDKMTFTKGSGPFKMPV